MFSACQSAQSFTRDVLTGLLDTLRAQASSSRPDGAVTPSGWQVGGLNGIV